MIVIQPLRTGIGMRLQAAVLTLSIILLGASTGSTDEWPKWRGPHDDNRSRETQWELRGDAAGPNLAWECSVGVGFSSIVVGNGKAFTVGNEDGEDIVSCIDVNDGSFVWQVRYTAPLDDRDFEGGPTATPTLDQNRLYVISREGDLNCFEATTGRRVWHQQIVDVTDVRLPGWGFSAAPYVVGDRLIVNAGESGVAFDKMTGELIWKSGDRECGYATPVLIRTSDPETLVIGSGRAYVGVRLDDGEPIWTQRWLTSFNCNAADPIVKDDELFLSSGYNRGAALFDLSTGTPQLVWKSKEMKNQIHSPILFGDHLYGIDGDMDTDAKLRCMEWKTGEIAWTAEDLRPGGITLAGDRLIVLTQDGELVTGRATPEAWSPEARSDVMEGKCWIQPVLSDGRIYCRSIEGLVVCVDCRK